MQSTPFETLPLSPLAEFVAETVRVTLIPPYDQPSMDALRMAVCDATTRVTRFMALQILQCAAAGLDPNQALDALQLSIRLLQAEVDSLGSKDNSH